MKIIIIILTVIVSTFIFGCSDTPKQTVAAVQSQPVPAPVVAVANTGRLKTIPVGEANFDKMATFIEKNGFPYRVGNSLTGHQYTFYDKLGNRHALVTEFGDTTDKTKVTEIETWSYLHGIKDQKHFFAFNITKEKVVNFMPEDNNKFFSEMKEGYEDFLAKVNKK